MAEQSTIAVYPLDGANHKFVVPYEYLARRFVTVTLLGTDRKPLVLGTDFRFISANQIETTQAWGDTQGYANIEVRRETSATQRLVDFYDGSVLRSRDLNVSAIQTIHIAEEARNMAGETLAENLEGNLDARFRKMVNLGVGTDDFDAVTVGQMKTWSASALNQANRSESEADRSQGQATLATQRAAAALASQNAAKVSETNSKTSETNSKTNENSAIAERIRVETARDVTVAARDTILAIELTANAANTSAISARDVAINARNAAQMSETKAKTSETNSKTSETNSKTSETNSKTSETNANAARDRAEAAKTIIENTELTSLANANSALASKNSAGVSESKAKASELAALGYRDEASTFVGSEYLRKDGNLGSVLDKEEARGNIGLDLTDEEIVSLKRLLYPQSITMLNSVAPPIGFLKPNILLEKVGDITYSEGRFIVGVKGLYSVCFSAITQDIGRVFLSKNGIIPTRLNHWGHAYAPTQYDTIVINTNMYLEAGEYVGFYLEEGSLYTTASDIFGTFSVSKIG